MNEMLQVVVNSTELNSNGQRECSIYMFCFVLFLLVCEAPPLLSHGEYTISADHLTVTYTCNLGYVLVGSAVRLCRTDGSGWDGLQPSCGRFSLI